jgi:2-isopropylmalate synthase
MLNRIEIYDTTLRDGTQGESINFNVADKIRIAEALDSLGVDFIEGGWPVRTLAMLRSLRKPVHSN